MMFALPGILCQKKNRWTGDVARYCDLELIRCNPQYTVTPPAILSTLTALWLDATDMATLSMFPDIPSGLDRVTQWNDKSGNSRNATEISAGRDPYYVDLLGKKWVLFGDGNYLKIDSTFFVGNNFHFFIVYKPFLLNTTRQTIFSNGNNDATNVFNIEVNGTQGISAFRLTTSMIAVNNIIDEVNIFEYERNGTTNRLSRAGNLLSSNTNATNYANSSQPSLIGARRASPLTQPFSGLIGELIITTGNLTTTNKNLIEGYLTWKWGLQSKLPLDHPYFNVGISGTVVDGEICKDFYDVDYFLLTKQDYVKYCPLEIDGEITPPAYSGDTLPEILDYGNSPIYIWDASNDASITTSGGKVSEWASGSYVLAQSDPALRPVQTIVDSKKVIQFNNSYLDYVDLYGVWGMSRTSFFIVFAKSNTSQANSRIFTQSNTNTGSLPTISDIDYDNIPAISNATSVGFYQGGTIKGTQSIAYDTFSLYELGYNASTFVTSVNGGTDTTITRTGGAGIVDQIRVGQSLNTSSAFFNGYIAEIVVIRTLGAEDIPTIIRQKTQGYLAWKWGLVANLPSGHPYKTTPPTA